MHENSGFQRSALVLKVIPAAAVTGAQGFTYTNEGTGTGLRLGRYQLRDSGAVKLESRAVNALSMNFRPSARLITFAFHGRWRLNGVADYGNSAAQAWLIGGVVFNVGYATAASTPHGNVATVCQSFKHRVPAQGTTVRDVWLSAAGFSHPASDA
jgi:hypothetical protein